MLDLNLTKKLLTMHNQGIIEHFLQNSFLQLFWLCGMRWDNIYLFIYLLIVN